MSFIKAQCFKVFFSGEVLGNMMYRCRATQCSYHEHFLFNYQNHVSQCRFVGGEDNGPDMLVTQEENVY